MLRQLLKSAGWSEVRIAASESALVVELDDGGMGSIRFLSPRFEEAARRFGHRIAELQFTDSDDVTVVASLNVDADGELLEMDIWKTDFGKVLAYPKSGRAR